MLVIDPGARAIDGKGGAVAPPSSLRFDTGTFRETPVPLGELQVDREGRLLVLGGWGKSGSTKAGNPIGSDPSRVDYWANNDFWYDDVSDGPVTAQVTLPDGSKRDIDDPKNTAWVIVSPPKYAPAIQPIITLYDVIRDAAVKGKWIKDYADVAYYRDIYPVLCRAADTAWVNQESQRGHGYDKGGDFRLQLKALATPDDSNKRRREFIVKMLRDPLATGDKAEEQATAHFMPPMSGDANQRTNGDFNSWLSLLPSQYRRFEAFKAGKYGPGSEPAYPPLQKMSADEQVEALQRAALEPCIGGAFFPGIEASWPLAKKETYVEAFRIKAKAGDVTKYMCLPWQADLFDCRDSWWPAARPDDVVPEEVLEEANKAWRPGQPQISEALEGRVKWARGLGVTTLFRHPWHNPAEAVDDPRDNERRGCDDMVRYWHELGFVLPRETAWRDPKSPEAREIVYVETGRTPHAGMDVRELVHCLLNIDDNRSCLPKVREFVDSVLAAARQLQQTADAFAWLDNIRPFDYSDKALDDRMKDIYDDCADFAFTENANGIRVRYEPGNPSHNPYFRTRENVIERIRQLTPFNFLDGAWLRNIHRVGPVDEVNSILFTILKEELGDGVPSQNHANIYRDLCHSFGFYPPPMNSMPFVCDTAFLDCAFDSPAFQLGISEFSNRYYPEIIGMSLWLEWTVMDLHRISSIVERVRLSSHFYRMHIAIDNAASGHGAQIVRAVKLYLAQVRAEGGDQAVEEHWRRIWDGYVAFAYTFTIVIKQVTRIIQQPLTRKDRLERLIREKGVYGQLNHGDHQIGGASINSWFADPEGFLDALVEHGYIIPGRPDQSRFFKLLEFQGGRMYRVFTEDEIKLWRDWTLELGVTGGDSRNEALEVLKDRLRIINLPVAKEVTDERIKAWQRVAADHRVALWLEVAIFEVRKQAENAAGRARRPPALDAERTDERPLSKKQIKDVIAMIEARYVDWLGWGMIRAATYVAAEYRDVVKDLQFILPDLDTGEALSVRDWFDRIRAAKNSTQPARAMLMALRDALRRQPGLGQQMFAPGTPLSYAFGSGVPGNDGRRASATLQAWLAAGIELPDPPPGPVKALRMDATLNEEEKHPTGLVMGFGTMH